jgi:hypothetical protein
LGEYFLIVNPAKKQYIDPPGTKWSTVFRNDDIFALALLLREVPAAERRHPLMGAWAGDPIYVAGDYTQHIPEPWNTAPENEEYGNLYFIAAFLYESITFQAFQMLYMLEPERFREDCPVYNPYEMDLVSLYYSATRFGSPVARQAILTILEYVGDTEPHIPSDPSAFVSAYERSPEKYRTGYQVALCPPEVRLQPAATQPRNPHCLIVNQTRQCYVDTRLFGPHLFHHCIHGFGLRERLRDGYRSGLCKSGHWSGDKMSTLSVPLSPDAPLSPRAAEVLTGYTDITWDFYMDFIQEIGDESVTLVANPDIVRELGRAHLRCPDKALAADIHSLVEWALSISREYFAEGDGGNGDDEEDDEFDNWLDLYGV